jgi:hypothetical protein
MFCKLGDLALYACACMVKAEYQLSVSKDVQYEDPLI